MKNIFFVVIFFFNILTFGQSYFFNSPEGFGSATTGGGNATPVTVTNYTNLKSNMTASDARVILVSGEITIPSGQPISAVIKNKTIIGLPGAKLINENQSNPGAGIIYLKSGSNNVIIRNLIFVGPGAYDIDGQDNLTSDGCTNLWVDHCEFQDGLDGNFDIKGLSDNVTVSWCKFTYLKPPKAGGSGGTNDHRFSDLLGSSSTDSPSDGHYSITFQNCYWADGCKERMQRARNAKLHILNCYYKTSVSSSLAIGLGGGTNNSSCYVQNTHFAQISNIYRSYVSTDGGTVGINFDNCLGNIPSNVGTVAAPSYSASIMPISEVASRVSDATCGAGATLQVTTSGIVTQGICSNLAINEIDGTKNIKVYPTIAKSFINIDFTNKILGDICVEIYTANGQKVITQNKPVNSAYSFKINIENLKNGVYLYNVKNNEYNIAGKFIKE